MARIQGDKRWDARLRRQARGVNVTPVLLKGAERARRVYVESINRITGSRTQTRSDPYRKVTVSDPGTPPNSDSGDLVNSSGVEVAGTNNVELFASAEHAAWMEFGNARVAPRPAMQPAFDKTKQSVLDDLIKYLAREARK